MEKIGSMSEEEKMRDYLRAFIKVYVETGKTIEIPSNQERLIEIIDSVKITLKEDSTSTATYIVSPEEITVIINNFKENSVDRNNFLLFHEFTHLISPINAELFVNQGATFEKIQDMVRKTGNPKITAMEGYYGLMAIDEVLAQWCGEKHNDEYLHKKRELKQYIKGPLDANVKYKSDFSDNDIYSPLEEPIECFVKRLGFSNLNAFSQNILLSNKGLLDKMDDSLVEQLCYIGKICRGIYKENNFLPNINITKEEIEEAYDMIYRNPDFGENNGTDERI